MFRSMWCAMAFAVAIFPAYGQDVREELRQLQQRIQQLEKRLQDTDAKARKAEEDAARAENTAAQASARPASENAFNPAISLILQGTAARSSLDPNTYRITGFAPPTGEIGPARRGFGLGESELVVTSNIDPYFRGQLLASLTPEDTVELEEAFFQTLALGKGFTIKGGRFLMVKPLPRDRKSTRLNSSHLVISYAVFCLKKKNNMFNNCLIVIG